MGLPDGGSTLREAAPSAGAPGGTGLVTTGLSLFQSDLEPIASGRARADSGEDTTGLAVIAAAIHAGGGKARLQHGAQETVLRRVGYGTRVISSDRPYVFETLRAEWSQIAGPMRSRRGAEFSEVDMRVHANPSGASARAW